MGKNAKRHKVPTTDIEGIKDPNKRPASSLSSGLPNIDAVALAVRQLPVPGTPVMFQVRKKRDLRKRSTQAWPTSSRR